MNSVSAVLKLTCHFPQDDNLDVTTYTVLILEKNSVEIHELAPGTAYLFKVQALSSDDSPGGSSMEEQFETLIEGMSGGEKPQGKGLHLRC